MKRIVIKNTVDTKGYDLPRMKDDSTPLLAILAIVMVLIIGVIAVGLVISN